MNAETAITTSLAALPGLEQSRRDCLEALAARDRNRASSPNQNGHPKRFVAPGGVVATDVVPWPRRPGVSRVRSACSEAATQLGYSRFMWSGGAFVLAAALTRGAMHLGLQSGPVVVHLVWPV